MDDLKAFALICTLTPSPEASSSDLMANHILGKLQEQGVTTSSARVVDHNVAAGVQIDMGRGAGLRRLRSRRPSQHHCPPHRQYPGHSPQTPCHGAVLMPEPPATQHCCSATTPARSMAACRRCFHLPYIRAASPLNDTVGEVAEAAG